MHCINKYQTFPNSALLQALLHLRGDVDKRPAGGHLKPELFAKTFHFFSPFSYRIMLLNESDTNGG